MHASCVCYINYPEKLVRMAYGCLWNIFFSVAYREAQEGSKTDTLAIMTITLQERKIYVYSCSDHIIASSID